LVIRLSSLGDILLTTPLLRESNLLQFKNFSDEMLCKKGFADESSVTVLALLYIIAGHEKHHLNVLEEKYLIP